MLAFAAAGQLVKLSCLLNVLLTQNKLVHGISDIFHPYNLLVQIPSYEIWDQFL